MGLYGHSDWGHGWGGPHQFGIIIAPKEIDLPDAVYDMPELKNIDGGTGPASLPSYLPFHFPLRNYLSAG